MLLDGVRVSYGVVDQSIYDDTVTDNSSDKSEYAAAENTITAADRVQLSYLEKNYFLLDGTFVFPEADTAYNVGWESAAIADDSGAINSYIEYQFANVHDSYGIQLIFPPYCAAKDFTIAYYKDTALVGSVTVNGNTLQRYANYDARLQWNRVRITFTKVNPKQRARLWEVTFGVSDEYDENTLISISASRSTDFSGDYDDCGEFSFQFYNDGRFNIKDINDLPVGLQEGLSVIVYVRKKGSTGYTPFGKYFSENTAVEDNGRTITVTGYDELYGLNDSTYRNGIVYPNGRSLKAWAEEVAADAGIELTVDSAFNSDISTGYITEVPHREALRLIAEAGNGVLIIDKSGSLSLVKSAIKTDRTLTADDIVDGGYSVDNTNKYLGIQITKYTYGAAKESVELGHLEEVLVTSEPQELEIVYSQYPVLVDTVKVFTESESVSITDKKVYADRIAFKVSANTNITSFITVTGTPYNTATTTVTRGSTVKNIKKIESNYLITGSLADTVADYQYGRVVNKYNRSVSVVTDTEIDLGDRIDIVTENTRATGDTVLVNKVGFSMAYGEYEETVEGVDE